MTSCSLGYRNGGNCAFRSVWLVLASFLFASYLFAEDAYLDGKTLVIPAVVVGNTFYRVELTLIDGSEPAEFQLVNAEEVSGVSSSGSSFFLNNVLSIPAVQVADTSYRISLDLIDPSSLRFLLSEAKLNASTTEIENITSQARELYSNAIEGVVVQEKCMACHFSGGIARDTDLLFQRQSATSAQNNFEIFKLFFERKSDGRALILSKVSGVNHTGGVQLPVGSDSYGSLSELLLLIEESLNLTVVNSDSLSFFDGVGFESSEDTLRRASMILAARAPTSEEIEKVQNGDDSDLRAVIRGIMHGDSFHKFLLEGANDRLLTEGVEFSVINPNFTNYPVYRNRAYELEYVSREPGKHFYLAWFVQTVDRLLADSVSELVAYVVESGRPYTEVLTADYMMFNPLLNELFGGTASFDDPSDMREFQPGVIAGYYIGNESMVVTKDQFGSQFVEDPGTSTVPYPHAGILNSPAFLARYPTTATNRNRARARWTMLHFLGIDVEKSSQRPTDAAALADTNNPTYNNPSCTACHDTLDPVAGAFQNWDHNNNYMPNGAALDRFYKHPKDGTKSPYQNGDSWYRGMKSPGLFNELVTDSNQSLQNLANLIVAEPSFSSATVKFWWPSIMGSKILLPPAVAQDESYEAKMDSYLAQSAEVERLASLFRVDFDLKMLFVEMLMSDWFRAETVDNSEYLDAHALSGLGSEKLLTPMRLQRKTLNLTGFDWRRPDYYGGAGEFKKAAGIDVDAGFAQDDFRLLYGGIDSSSITERATEITPIMASVAQTHALESACPIVLREFTLPESERKLFFGITGNDTPLSDAKLIRAKLVDLHKIFLGKVYNPGSPEIDVAFELLLDSWSEKVERGGEKNLVQDSIACELWTDRNFMNDLPFTGDIFVIQDDGRENFNWNEIWPFLSETGGVDETYIKQGWVTIVAYLMSHYHYLHE